jgi:hypothetical protein
MIIKRFIETLEMLSTQLSEDEKTKLPSNSKNQQFLNTKEAAAFLCVSERTLYSYRKSGLPYSQIGRKVIFNIQDLLDYLKDHQINEKNGGSHV